MLEVTDGFSKANAHYLAMACKECAEGDSEQDRQILGLDTIRTLCRGDVYCILGETKEFTLLAFRGSMAIGNWIKDLEINLSRWGMWPGRVHSGFWAIWSLLLPWVVNCTPKTKPLWITGHSMGGAVALLAAHDLHSRGWPRVESVYTFGCPKTGDADFAEVWGKGEFDHYRVVNRDDIVPHTPPWSVYEHVGTEEWISHTNEILEGPGGWPRIASEFVSYAGTIFRHPRQAALQCILDHQIANYIDALAPGPIDSIDAKAAA